MSDAKPNLFTRDDTFFGVCEGLGQDTGIPANVLRLAFAGFLFWNPYLALGTYLGLGVLIFATRWIFPERGAAAEQAPEVQPAADQPAVEEEHEPLPLAA